MKSPGNWKPARQLLSSGSRRKVSTAPSFFTVVRARRQASPFRNFTLHGHASRSGFRREESTRTNKSIGTPCTTARRLPSALLCSDDGEPVTRNEQLAGPARAGRQFTAAGGGSQPSLLYRRSTRRAETDGGACRSLPAAAARSSRGASTSARAVSGCLPTAAALTKRGGERDNTLGAGRWREARREREKRKRARAQCGTVARGAGAAAETAGRAGRHPSAPAARRRPREARSAGAVKTPSAALGVAGARGRTHAVLRWAGGRRRGVARASERGSRRQAGVQGGGRSQQSSRPTGVHQKAGRTGVCWYLAPGPQGGFAAAPGPPAGAALTRGAVQDGRVVWVWGVAVATGHRPPRPASGRAHQAPCRTADPDRRRLVSCAF